MTFKQRLPYFLGGLTIGVIFVLFIWNKKETEPFAYSPNSRILKNIRIKNRLFSAEVLTFINSYKVDTSQISQILKNGNVDVWNKEKLEGCIRYRIKGRKDLKNVTLTIKNCDSTATIEKITIK
ncbi:MAG: hypothetical protein COC16_02930 [Lutibacter sp.]|nr:MAG: hypothetical protein COC16_02930 [Lutibacter sp.]